ncbi:unnamed protein product (macronuclear) [Paramecium tetraurelia]|uniref:Kinesin-like protein n=1 Tax=Paramecium tetraurelia TaxID=5888 RepID=A0C7N7_PARTE|nr:uncharacterized protein GSPATT00035934001 [Paramecium tetraurelia]CAK66804.1 unnamed protein product [Paramecium tetraurelia]|eukprot:XP_001434201.1 hypothetical protein (macronuclear) [Paramecium tetraurelia strain d4-2]
MSDLADKIVVVIRKRPLGKKELAKKDEDIVDVQSDQSVIVREVKQKVDLTKYVEEHMFNFDLAFDQNASNQQVYLNAVRPIIEAAFNKARVTCFAYGQTGSGKTHTMLGDVEKQIPGMYILAANDIFQLLQQPEFQHLIVGVSFFEIYCGKLFDLLNQRGQIQIREDAKGNVNLINLMEKRVNSVQSLMQIITQGQTVRVTAQNGANNESSRSHAILQINLRAGKNVFGKLSFIDLAGSERGADVQDSNKQTRIDGAEINKSLLALKECIRALDLNKNHTPFRGSKLTLVLKDSLTGNCKTVMIGNISPSSSSSEHTLNTLRYADRVKELKKPQDKQFQGDYVQRELMLARQNTNVVRKAYKNPDDEDDEDISCNSMSNSLFPQQQQQFMFQQQQQMQQQQQIMMQQQYQSNQFIYQQQQQQQQQFIPQQQQQLQQPLQQQQNAPKLSQIPKNSSQQNSNNNLLNRFNLGSFPTINGGSSSNIMPNNSRQYTQQNLLQQQPSCSSIMTEVPQQQPQLFQQQSFQQNKSSLLFPQQQQQYCQNNNNLFQENTYEQGYQQQQSNQQALDVRQDSMVEEELCINNPNYFSVTGRYSQESQSSRQSSTRPLQEINNYEGSKYFNNRQFTNNDYQYQQHILNEHKQTIDKIVEITKDEMINLQQVQSPQDMSPYVSKVMFQLQNKMDLIANLHQKMKQYQKDFETRGMPFQPNSHTFSLFQQDDNLLNIDDNVL